jgi:hypothetical protein
VHLAHINIGTMKGPITSKVMLEFRTQIAHYNSLADRSSGFVWRLQTSSGHTADIDAFGDERIFITMSVWEGIEQLFDFTYRSAHAEMFRRRREWMEKIPRPQLALWWIGLGHIPSIKEAKERLASVAESGATPFAFTFRRHFPPPR